MTELPSAVAEVVDLLASLPGTNAVVLGGSHVLGSADAHSDWDLGLYYVAVDRHRKAKLI
jgi:hypothetical protein